MTPETQGYVDIPNVAGNYLSVSYLAAFNLAYPFTVIYHFQPTTWPPTQEAQFMGRGTSATNWSWRTGIVPNRFLKSYLSADGTASTGTFELTAPTSLPTGRNRPNNDLWMAWVIAASAAGSATKYLHGWVSHNGTTWQDMGRTTIGGGAITLFLNSLPLNIGVGRQDQAPAAHKLFYAALRPGSSGTEAPSTTAPVFEFDAKTDLVGVAPNAASFNSKSGHIVNVARTGTPGVQLVAPAAYVAAALPTEPNQPPPELLRDGLGVEIPRARVARKLVEPFITATVLPSWLERRTGATGTGVQVYPVNGNNLLDIPVRRGGLVMRTTGAQTEGVQTTFEASLSDPTGGTETYELLFAVDGLYMSNEDMDLTIGLSGVDCGVELFIPRSSAADPIGKLRFRRPGGYDQVDAAQQIGGTSPSSRMIGLRVRPVDGHVTVLDEGEPYFTHDGSTGLVAGPVRGFIQYAGNGTADRYVLARQIRFEITSN